MTLEAAYSQARYRLLLPNGVYVHRVGVVNAQIDASLRDASCSSHWHLITPCNPRSRQLDAFENTERLRRFADELGTHAWEHAAAISEADNGDWREAGYIILDAPDHAMRALAQRYEQSALLYGALDQAPQLVWLDR